MKTYYYNLGMAFSDIAAQYADKPALRYESGLLTYADLDQQVTNLSTYLLEKGIQRGQVIAIGHNKKPLSYALMLAALRLGIVYVNIDVASPLPRNLSIIKQSGASLLFYDDECYQASVSALAQAYQSECILLNEQMRFLPADHQLAEQQQRMRAVDGDSIAYIMFTSGSTGIPKGVAVTHQNILHFIAWGQAFFQITPEHNFANLSPMYFDNSVFDFYNALFSGASITPVDRKLLTSPYELVQYVHQSQCNIWFSVPSLLIYLTSMKAMKSAYLPHLTCILFGGEGYPKVELNKLYQAFKNQADLVNVYGPTECTCICSGYLLQDEDFQDLNGLPPLGQLNQNVDYLILDEHGEPKSQGELCLIGPNVAAGYFNDFERTATSFVTLYDSAKFMKRMYRTGDLVEEKEGVLYFVGRKDNQIKHMGYRIELEEIEQALVRLPQVNQAVAIYYRANTAYGKIIAFVSSSADEFNREDALKALKKSLPDYMIPSTLHIQHTLPKNANGKLDRQKLYNLIDE